jgi:hypothetical protein
MAQQIVALPNPDARANALVEKLRGGAAPGPLAQTFADDTTMVGIGKPLLLAMVNHAAADECDQDSAIAICNAVIQAAGRRTATYGDEVVRAREVLADVYEGSDQPQQALQVLLGMPTDAGLRSATDDYKASLYVRIADLSLDVDNTNQAETYV